jgi:hypothetical protein
MFGVFGLPGEETVADEARAQRAMERSYQFPTAKKIVEERHDVRIKVGRTPGAVLIILTPHFSHQLLEVINSAVQQSNAQTVTKADNIDKKHGWGSVCHLLFNKETGTFGKFTKIPTSASLTKAFFIRLGTEGKDYLDDHVKSGRTKPNAVVDICELYAEFQDAVEREKATQAAAREEERLLKAKMEAYEAEHGLAPASKKPKAAGNSDISFASPFKGIGGAASAASAIAGAGAAEESGASGLSAPFKDNTNRRRTAATAVPSFHDRRDELHRTLGMLVPLAQQFATTLLQPPPPASQLRHDYTDHSDSYSSKSRRLKGLSHEIDKKTVEIEEMEDKLISLRDDDSESAKNQVAELEGKIASRRETISSLKYRQQLLRVRMSDLDYKVPDEEGGGTEDNSDDPHVESV